MKIKKQIAMKSFSGGNGAFLAGLNSLAETVQVAGVILRQAECFLPLEVKVPHDPTGRASRDWQLEFGWSVALACQAMDSNGGVCTTLCGRCEFETESGLKFFWGRWDSEPGYTFGVLHPTGRFLYRSTLRAALVAAGWQINSYDSDGCFIFPSELEL